MDHKEKDRLRSLLATPKNELSDEELRYIIEQTGLCLVHALSSVAQKKKGGAVEIPRELREKRIASIMYVDRLDRVWEEREDVSLIKEDVLEGLRAAARRYNLVWREMHETAQFLNIPSAQEILRLIGKGKEVIIRGYLHGTSDTGKHFYHILGIKNDYYGVPGIPTVACSDGEERLLANFEKEIDYTTVNLEFNAIVFF